MLKLLCKLEINGKMVQSLGLWGLSVVLVYLRCLFLRLSAFLRLTARLDANIQTDMFGESLT